MGMALPKPKFDEQIRAGRMQAEKVLPPEYVRALELQRRRAAVPRELSLWGFVRRWTAMPVVLRRVLAAVIVLSFIGSFAAVAHIQSELAKGKLEQARYTMVSQQDNLDELSSLSKSKPNFRLGDI